MAEPVKTPTGGLCYRIEGPNSLMLADLNGRATLVHPNFETPGIDCWQAWWSDGRGWKFTNWETGRTLRATEPPRHGGPPIAPPARGAPVYLTDHDDGRRYSLWTLRSTDGERSGLEACNCFEREPRMMLNVRGDSWDEQTAEMITWEWHGGQPNEMWLCYPLDPQPSAIRD